MSSIILGSLASLCEFPNLFGTYPGIFITILTQLELNILVSLFSSLIISPLTAIDIFSLRMQSFDVRKGLTVFQNFLL